MPDDDPTEDIEGGENDSEGMRNVRKALKRAEADRDAFKAAAERTPTLERELAFAKAGIAADSPIAPYFTKGYEGELTPEAIRTAAQAAGVPLLAASTEATGGNGTERKAEVDAHRQMDATTGGNQGGGTDTDAYMKALDEAGYDAEKILDVAERFGMATTRNRPG